MVFFNSSNARRLTAKRELCHMWNIPRPIIKESRGLRNVMCRIFYLRMQMGKYIGSFGSFLTKHYAVFLFIF